MSNLVQEVENEVIGQRKYGFAVDGILELRPGGGAQTVYVCAFEQGGAKLPAFALEERGPWYGKGFSWKHSDQPLTVTFAFSSDIAGVRTQHRELSFLGRSQRQQQMRIPANAATYDFDVEFTAGDLHDPVIIVTPNDTPP